MSGMQISHSDLDSIPAKCDYDLPTLVFVSMYIESPIFRKAVGLGTSAYEQQAKDIYKKVSKMSPEAIK